MKKFFLITALAVNIFALQSCEKDDLANPGRNKNVKNTFKTMYPDATHVEWEKEGKYWKADFRKDNKEIEAWFTMDGEWYQTETDLTFTELPEAVKTSFSSDEYKDWHVDDVDMFERKNVETFYVLDVKKFNNDYDLYYLSDGTLIKTIEDR